LKYEWDKDASRGGTPVKAVSPLQGLLNGRADEASLGDPLGGAYRKNVSLSCASSEIFLPMEEKTGEGRNEDILDKKMRI
jgi:hypothetical protein